MNKHHLLLVLTALVIVPAYSQEFTRQDADSMTSALKKTKQEINRIDLLLNLAQFHISKPAEVKTDLDSAAVYINQARPLCKKINLIPSDGYLLLTESCLTNESGKKEEGKSMAEKAVAILEKGDNKLYLGKAYYEYSQYFNQWDSAQAISKIAFVQKAVDAFTLSGNRKYLARGLEMLGRVYYNDKGDDHAIPVLNRALAIYDSIHESKVQGVYLALGRDYYSRLDYGRALYFFLKALRTSNQVGDTTIQLWEINILIGKTYQDIDRQDMGLKYLKDALAISRKYKNDYSSYNTVMNISTTYSDLEQYDEALKILAYLPEHYLQSHAPFEKGLITMCFFNAHMRLKQYDAVRLYYDTLLKIVDNSLIDDYRRANIYRLIATYHFRINDFGKSQFYLTKGHAIGKKLNFESSLIRDMKLQYQLDSVKGNFASAFTNLLSYKVKMDSVTGVKKARQFEVLSVEYELGLKEDSIRMKDKDIGLLTERNSLQQVNLKQAKLIRNVFIGGIILAGIIIGLLYRQYRQKQRSNNLISGKNAQLQHLLTEKEWLLKEIHHRVKNNLQIVMSLLNSQSVYIDNEPALTAIHDSQHRVHAMSLIHQKLYNTENVSSIDMSLYVRELTAYLMESFDTRQKIRVEFNIEPLEMDVSQAVPLGLILNEAITNTIKYAFPGDMRGTTSISLTTLSQNHYLLTIADNGIGIPQASINRKEGSLGMSLMKGLSEDLDGSLEIENNKGTVIRVSFVHEPVLQSRKDKFRMAETI